MGAKFGSATMTSWPRASRQALAFGSGIHGAAAFLLRGVQEGKVPSLADVQAFFEAYWQLETGNRPIRFGEKDKERVTAAGGPLVLAIPLLAAGHGCPHGTPPNNEPGPSLYCAVIVKTVDEETRAMCSINELLCD